MSKFSKDLREALEASATGDVVHVRDNFMLTVCSKDDYEDSRPKYASLYRVECRLGATEVVNLYDDISKAKDRVFRYILNMLYKDFYQEIYECIKLAHKAKYDSDTLRELCTRLEELERDIHGY